MGDGDGGGDRRGVIGLWQIVTVAFLVGLGVTAPAAMRPWMHAAGGVIVLAAIAPATVVLLIVLTAIVLTATSSRGPVAVALVVVIGSFLGYRTASALDVAVDGVVVVGAAFAVPRCIHVIVDVATGKLAQPGAAAVIQYLWFWPTVVIGPIHRFDEHQREQRRARWEPQLAARGLERVLTGLFAVLVVANVVTSRWLAGAITELPDQQAGLRAALESVEYGLTLYASFAGWSSVAIGLAALLGYRVVENFRHPFAQPNIAAFWRGWHVSLTRFATEYVYRPVAAHFRIHVVAVFATMVVIATWHELSGRYLAWAAYHATGLAVHRRFASWRGVDGTQKQRFFPKVVSTVTTFVFVMLGFTFTRSNDLGAAVDAFRLMLYGGW